jgi:hypothetical protein
MGMVCATAEGIATVLWVMLHPSVTTLVQVAVRTVAQLLTPMVSIVFKTKILHKLGCCLACRFE